jgi:Flp pilus assembly protein TadD
MRALHIATIVFLSVGVATILSDTSRSADGISNTFTAAGIRAELTKARDDIERGDYWAAISRLNDVVTTDPRNADAYNLLGFSYRKTKEFDLAERNYLRALRLNPEHKGALEYMGELYLETGRRTEAEELLALLQKLCPDGCEELDDLRQAFDEG